MNYIHPAKSGKQILKYVKEFLSRGWRYLVQLVQWLLTIHKAPGLIPSTSQTMLVISALRRWVVTVSYISGFFLGCRGAHKQRESKNKNKNTHRLWITCCGGSKQGKAQFLLLRHLGVPKTILQKPRAEWNKSFKSTAQMQKLSTHFCLKPALLCHLSIVPRSWIYTHLQRPWHTALHSVFTHTPWQNCSTENTLTMISSESVIKFCNKHMVFNVENTNLACSLGEEASTFN